MLYPLSYEGGVRQGYPVTQTGAECMRHASVRVHRAPVCGGKGNVGWAWSPEGEEGAQTRRWVQKRQPTAARSATSRATPANAAVSSRVCTT